MGRSQRERKTQPLCASVFASVKWGHGRWPCLPHRWVSHQVAVRLSDAWEGAGRGLTSLHTHSREEGRKDSLRGKQLPGHTGSALRGARAQGGKGNQVWTGIKHQRWSRRGGTVGSLTVRDDWGQPRGARDPRRDRLLGKVGISAERKEELCRGEGWGPAGEKVLCRKNLCALAPLRGCPGCPETDSGVWQKHTSDRKGGCGEVQLAAARGRSALPLRPQPTERAPGQAWGRPCWGRGVGLYRGLGTGVPGWGGLTSV